MTDAHLPSGGSSDPETRSLPSVGTVRSSTARHETAEETEKREHDEAIRTWHASEPKAQYVGLMGGYGMPHSVRATHLDTSEKIRTAARELLDYADWWDAKPEGYE